MEGERTTSLLYTLPILIFLLALIWFLIKDKSLKIAKEIEKRKGEQEFTNALSQLHESPENYQFLVKTNSVLQSSEVVGWYKTDFYGALKAVLATCSHPLYKSYSKPAVFSVLIKESEKRVYVVPGESSFTMGV